jgi:hypothetical protein
LAVDIHDKSGSNIILSRQFSEDFLRTKSKEELIRIILNKTDIQIPISLFLNAAGPLECLVKYLKDELGLSIKDISFKLNRNIQTIWTTYRNSRNKKIEYKSSQFTIPLSIFSKEDKSVLESLVFYLNDSFKLRFCEISKLLNRDNREVWMYYHRYTAKEKLLSKGGNKNEKNRN